MNPRFAVPYKPEKLTFAVRRLLPVFQGAMFPVSRFTPLPGFTPEILSNTLLLSHKHLMQA